ncbi:UPF0496 PROTEIN 3-RELATED [Salix koriyanagi]|uniref:UPF0496 PROTEIN 3-RELATED n=1 Tax=Salix koriyanagi TaxID=2511006 RepID=A0A9Q0SSV5_9ROSI|nr:UPF0496 PROTEIN 3-RELATED [Salix koriyanagi]
MKKRIGARIKTFLSRSDTKLGANSPGLSMEIDVREEYANAFRTESYNHFWARLQALSNRDPTTRTALAAESTTSAARLPSYRLFVENLLDPDQSSVIRILSLIHTRPGTHSLLSDYFTQTATRITEFVNAPDLFDRSGSTPPSRVQGMQADCFKLLKQLESKRDRAKAKLNLKNKLKHSSAIFLVAMTASLTIIIATHAVALLVATPGLIAATSLGLGSTRRLARVAAQLDAAAKGTYILSRDLETISRLVNRVNDEMEHMHSTVKYWVERGDDEGKWLHGINGEVVVKQFNKINECCSFSNQVDDLEEHLYLCFMTINRARNLVLKEILDPGP